MFSQLIIVNTHFRVLVCQSLMTRTPTNMIHFTYCPCYTIQDESVLP